MSSVYVPPHQPDIPLRPDGRPYPPVRPRALSEEAKETQQRLLGFDRDRSLRRVRWPAFVAIILGAGVLAVSSLIMSTSS
jgi:hypothetical protein